MQMPANGFMWGMEMSSRAAERKAACTDRRERDRFIVDRIHSEEKFIESGVPLGGGGEGGGLVSVGITDCYTFTTENFYYHHNTVKSSVPKCYNFL